MFKLFFTAVIIFPCIAPMSREATLQAQSPSTPIVGQLVDSVKLKGTEDVFIDGDYAYLPCRQGQRLTICSIKDPAHPKIISSFTHSQLGVASGFAINGNTVYVTSMSHSRLLVIDATNKSELRLLGSVSIGGTGRVYKVAYRDGYCFVPNIEQKKLFIVDVRNPKQPTVVSSVIVTTEADGPFSVLLHGDYALVGTIFGTKRNRLAVIDVKNPAKPRLVTQVFGADIGQVSGQVADNIYFSVNWDKDAFLVFDIADPDNPKLRGKLIDKRLGAPNRCTISGNRAYLPMGEGHGVAVIDISNPEDPQFITSYRDPVLLKKAYGAAVRDNLLFVASRDGSSLVIFDRHALEKK